MRSGLKSFTSSNNSSKLSKSINDLDRISNLLTQSGNTLVNLKVHNENKDIKFQLHNRRNIDRKTLNLIKNKEISAIIN